MSSSPFTAAALRGAVDLSAFKRPANGPGARPGGAAGAGSAGSAGAAGAAGGSGASASSGGVWSFDFYTDIKNSVFAPSGWKDN